MELEKFSESIAGKSPATIKTYSAMYNKLRKLLDKDIAHASQKKIIETAMSETNLNSSQALLNIGLMVRRMEDLNVDELEKQRKQNQIALAKHVKKKNIQLVDSLPSLKDLEDYTEDLYENGKWKEYIINYLLLNYQVRNKDLVFTLVKRKMDATDPDKNYIWLRGKVATYIRRNYKTSSTYGQLVHKIHDPKFVTAIRRMMALQKTGDGVFIPTESQAGYYIQKYTYQELGESKYVKIVIDANRGDLQKLREISKNRATDINTLLESYDIKNV